MMRILCCLMLLAGVPLLATDITGTWTGSFDTTGPEGQTKASTAYMKLKQTEDVITGTAGPSEDRQWPISKGVIQGNKITFEVQSDGPLMKFALELVEEHIRGEATAEREGQTMKAKLDLTRRAINN